MKNQVNLSKFQNKEYDSGGFVKRALWYLVNSCFFLNPLSLSSGIKRILLRLFGAKIGAGTVIKPRVNIKYPWKLEIGDHVWIGENVWIDNLARVKLGNNVCLSQGAMLLTGNHNYRKITFDLMIGEIILEDGVWIGARSLVCPHVVCRSHAVLSAQSTAVKELEAYAVYQGNPAIKVKEREIS